ncbi:hypothetical protein, conserved in T. vivax [Trypanosoma vivax Y486]|uniref:Uncharacterized protein n=1 Tax=Trypanosoma vivax (strain Y486) TaxID=1055687 RepID=F9WUH5_TRYVY|nr:hypothetical protein, conserved in T. vivax [Trypanosoma vivax Y486]|eukprot:CCD21224.1 hypothetical protein, conserved in T. vivax [Trypanosoma vivax Y486]
MVDDWMRRAVCVLLATPWCMQSDHPKRPIAQLNNSFEAENAAHVVVGLFKSYNYTFGVLHERANELLREASTKLESSKGIYGNLRNFTRQPGAADAVSATISALQSAEQTHQEAQGFLEATLVALDNISLISNFSTSFVLKETDRQGAPAREVEMIERPFSWGFLMKSGYGAREHFNNSAQVLWKVYQNADQATMLDYDSVDEWRLRTRELWESALVESKSKVKTVVGRLVDGRMTSLLKELKDAKLSQWWKVERDKEQLVNKQIAAVESVFLILKIAALQHLDNATSKLRNASLSLQASEELNKRAIEKIVSAQRDAICRATWRVEEVGEGFSRHQAEAPASMKNAYGVLVRLNEVGSAVISARADAKRAHDSATKMKRAASRSLGKSEEVDGAVAHSERARATAWLSLASAKKAVEDARRSCTTAGDAVAAAGEADMFLESARSAYSDISIALNRVNEISATVSAALKCAHGKLRESSAFNIYHGSEAYRISCRGINDELRARVNERDEQLLWALELFEGGRAMRSALDELTRSTERLRDAVHDVEAKMKVTLSALESAGHHVTNSKKYTEEALSDARSAERNSTYADELSANASREVACGKRGTVCGLIAQLHGLKLNLTSLKEQTLQSERAAASARERANACKKKANALVGYEELPVGKVSGAAEEAIEAGGHGLITARKAGDGADKALASVAEYLSAVGEVLNSIVCGDVVSAEISDSCGVVADEVTRASLASAVSQYSALWNATDTGRVDERLVYLSHEWETALALHKESVLQSERAVRLAWKAERMTRAGQKDAFCRGMGHLRGIGGYLSDLKVKAKRMRSSASEAKGQLRDMQNAIEGIELRVADAVAIVKKAVATSAKSGVGARNVVAASENTTKAVVLADASSVSASKAISKAGEAELLSDAAARDTSSAQRLVTVASDTYSEAMSPLHFIGLPFYFPTNFLFVLYSLRFPSPFNCCGISHTQRDRWASVFIFKEKVRSAERC